MITLLVLLFSVSAKCYGQQKKDNLLKKIASYIDGRALAGMDSDYVELPKYAWEANVYSYLGELVEHIDINNIHLNSLRNAGVDVPIGMKVDMRSGVSHQLCFKVGYRGYGLSYSFDLQKRFNHDLSFSMQNNVYGFDIRYHTTTSAYGEINTKCDLDEMSLQMSNLAERDPQQYQAVVEKLYDIGMLSPNAFKPVEINRGDAKNDVVIANAYYVFSHDKFAYSAALCGDIKQKRSAGSFLLNACYMYRYTRAHSDRMKEMTEGLHNICTHQLAFGGGYAYNYVLCKGKLMLHVSPTIGLMVKNKTHIHFTDEDDMVHNELTQEVEKSSVNPIWVVRANAQYDISDRIAIKGSYLWNHFFSGRGSFAASTNDWVARIGLGVFF